MRVTCVCDFLEKSILLCYKTFCSAYIDEQNKITKGINPERRPSSWNINCEAVLPTHHQPSCKPVMSNHLDR